MKILTIICLWCLSALSCHASATMATVTNKVYNRTGTVAASTRVTFTAIHRPLVKSIIVYPGWQVTKTTDTNGIYSVDLVADDYSVQYGNDARDQFIIWVPDTTNTYDITQLITNAVTYTRTTSPIYEEKLNKNITNGYVGLDANGLIPASLIGGIGSTNGVAWINVTNYGARGNNVADDTAAINAAFASASPSNTIYFPPGVYRITNSITYSGAIANLYAGTNKTVYDGNMPGIWADDGATVRQLTTNASGFDFRTKTAVRKHLKFPAVLQLGSDGRFPWQTNDNLGDMGVVIGTVDSCIVEPTEIAGFTFGFVAFAYETNTVGYNTFHWGKIANCKTNMLLGSRGAGGAGWANHNTIEHIAFQHSASIGTNVPGVVHLALLSIQDTTTNISYTTNGQIITTNLTWSPTNNIMNNNVVDMCSFEGKAASNQVWCAAQFGTFRNNYWDQWSESVTNQPMIVFSGMAAYGNYFDGVLKEHKLYFAPSNSWPANEFPASWKDDTRVWNYVRTQYSPEFQTVEEQNSANDTVLPFNNTIANRTIVKARRFVFRSPMANNEPDGGSQGVNLDSPTNGWLVVSDWRATSAVVRIVGGAANGSWTAVNTNRAMLASGVNSDGIPFWRILARDETSRADLDVPGKTFLGTLTATNFNSPSFSVGHLYFSSNTTAPVWTEPWQYSFWPSNGALRLSWTHDGVITESFLVPTNASGSGITSINGDTTAAQTIPSGPEFTASTAGGATQILLSQGLTNAAKGGFGTNNPQATLEVWSTSEVASFRVGSPTKTNQFEVKTNGNVTASGTVTATGSITTSGNVTAGITGVFQWNNRTVLYSTNNGTLLVTKWDGVTPGRIVSATNVTTDADVTGTATINTLLATNFPWQQPASATLTNWSGIATNALTGKLDTNAFRSQLDDTNTALVSAIAAAHGSATNYTLTASNNLNAQITGTNTILLSHDDAIFQSATNHTLAQVGSRQNGTQTLTNLSNLTISDGDLITSSNGVLKVLPIGTSGQVLTATASGPVYSNAGSRAPRFACVSGQALPSLETSGSWFLEEEFIGGPALNQYLYPWGVDVPATANVYHQTNDPAGVGVMAITSAGTDKGVVYLLGGAQLCVTNKALVWFTRVKVSKLDGGGSTNTPIFGWTDSKNTLPNNGVVIIATNNAWNLVTAFGGARTVTQSPSNIVAETYYVVGAYTDVTGTNAYFYQGTSGTNLYCLATNNLTLPGSAMLYPAFCNYSTAFGAPISTNSWDYLDCWVNDFR